MVNEMQPYPRPPAPCGKARSAGAHGIAGAVQGPQERTGGAPCPTCKRKSWDVETLNRGPALGKVSVNVSVNNSACARVHMKA